MIPWTLPPLTFTHWALIALAAFCVGMSKTGISGLGIVSVALFSVVLSPKDAVGCVLLVLITADILAIITYRRDAEWRHLWRLFPYAVPGVFAGFFTMRYLTALGPGGDVPLRRLIAVVLLLVVIVQVAQRLRKPSGNKTDPKAEAALHPLASPLTGVLGGFTTMVANAAGPIMTVYLLSMRLPKIAFVGTAAWFFFCMNLFKVPFGIALHTITWDSLHFAITLLPVTITGGLIGRVILRRINQKTFETIAIAFTLTAALYLLFRK